MLGALEGAAALWQIAGYAGASMKVISLQSARSRLRPRQQPIRPPPVLTGPFPAAVQAPAHCEADEDRLRMRQNMAAFVVIVAIVVLGSWLIETLHSYSRIQTCLEVGHRNCIPLDHKYQPSPY
jgi:hypothetical protein